jgi:hypothetical protein
MNKKPEVTIKLVPSYYKGWKMEYNQHGNGHDAPFFWARKGRQVVSENSTKYLMAEIDRAENTSKKFKNPIRCMMRGSGGWRYILVHTLWNDRLYYTEENGEESSAFISNLKNGYDKIFLRTEQNIKLNNDAVELRRQADALTGKANELESQMAMLTEEALMLAVKEQKPATKKARK